MGMRILGWGTALPDKVVTNADLEKTLETSDEWIVERSGIRERRIGDSTTDLAVGAGRAAIGKAGVDPASIDLMILATTTPDQQVPATSAQVHHELQLSGGAFDLNAACSGFVYALVTANALLSTGPKRILVVGAETLSRITDWTDRNTAVLFGDGGGAIVVESVPDEGQLLAWDLGLDAEARHILHGRARSIQTRCSRHGRLRKAHPGAGEGPTRRSKTPGSAPGKYPNHPIRL